mmetsp:Transcript_2872/g.8118  ORF Transcript_2872/g.8118 Transcript_2872/m.8118 type:complete len:267 (-) Transcript_2872:326-1126(-)
MRTGQGRGRLRQVDLQARPRDGGALPRGGAPQAPGVAARGAPRRRRAHLAGSAAPLRQDAHGRGMRHAGAFGPALPRARGPGRQARGLRRHAAAPAGDAARHAVHAPGGPRRALHGGSPGRLADGLRVHLRHHARGRQACGGVPPGTRLRGGVSCEHHVAHRIDRLRRLRRLLLSSGVRGCLRGHGRIAVPGERATAAGHRMQAAAARRSHGQVGEAGAVVALPGGFFGRLGALLRLSFTGTCVRRVAESVNASLTDACGFSVAGV